MGSSGAGKTTLLNLLVGYERPDSGRIEGAPSVFWVPQDRGLWPPLTAREHLIQVNPDAEFDRLLALLDLDHRADARPAELSQGEAARLAIARALAAQADVLVMDEPLANIDEARSRRYWRVILAEARSLVYATHAPATVIGDAERVICLRDGELIYDGDVHSLYHDPPTAESANCLGPGNWFTAEESTRWLGAEHQHLRPETLRLEPGDDCEVRSVRHEGPIYDVELDRDGEPRRFFCSGPLPKVGSRVALLVLMALLLLGCDSRNSTLPVTFVAQWQLPPDGPRIPAPRGLAALASGEIAVLDDAGRVLIFADGQVTRQWRMPDIALGHPEGICELRNGELAVADTHYHRVVVFNPDGEVARMFGSDGQELGQFGNPVGIATDGERLFVCEYGANDRVQVFDSTGTPLLAFGKSGTGDGEFQRPSGICWRDGRVYVADAVNNRVQVFAEDGRFQRVIGGDGFYLPYDIALDGDALIVVEYGGARVTRLGPDGEMFGRFGRTGSDRDEFVTPWGITVDAAHQIIVADTGNRRLVVFGP
jgi:ABC-type lipoprotein export system ATPase subunit/sugar lactone lactonase YvrE